MGVNNDISLLVKQQMTNVEKEKNTKKNHTLKLTITKKNEISIRE